MLKVEKGVIGNKQLASLELTEEDREVIKKIAVHTPKFYSNNGCGLNLVDMLQGKLVIPCNDTEFKHLQDAVCQFNIIYFPVKNWESDYIELEDKYNNLLSEYTSFKNKIKNILENNK